MIKFSLIPGLLIFSIILSAQSPRQSMTINADWKFFRADAAGAQSKEFDDKQWETVNLPHTWNVLDVLDETPGYYRGAGWYRHWEQIPADSSGKIMLFFEAVSAKAEVYINGALAGSHKGAFTAFCVDITPYVRFGEKNLIAVKADNAHDNSFPSLHGDFSIFGGIYRDVFIVNTAAIHFDCSNHASTGVFIETPFINENNASVKVSGDIVNEKSIEQKLSVNAGLYDNQNKLVGNIKGKVIVRAFSKAHFDLTSAPVNAPQLWSPENPYLYRVVVQVMDDKNKKVFDEESLPLGFRWFGADAEKGFLLNGHPYKLKGAARHQDFDLIGNALPDAIHRNDMIMLKNMGANFVRICHYPQDPAIYEICDKLGLIVWSEIPIVDHIAMTGEFFANSLTMMKEMILQNYNHPSVAMWGYMNEVFGYLDWYMKSAPENERRTLMKETARLARKLDSLSRAADPHRLTVIAMHTDPYPLYYKESGMLDIAMINGWNVYQGWYHNNLDSLGKTLDYLYSLQPNKPIFLSEYGAESDPRINTYNPTIFDNSSRYQEKFNEKYLAEGNKRDYMAGFAIWNLIDFQRDGRSDAVRAMNNKGMLTTDRKPKNVYYLNQAHWSALPMIHIASEFWINRTEVTDSAMLMRPVAVYTNQNAAELFHNGKSLGKKNADNHSIVWTIPFVSGKNDLLVVSGELRDFVSVKMSFIPKSLAASSWENININAGQTRTCFTDELTGEYWIHDLPYTPGSFGSIGGTVYANWPDMKAWQGIRQGVNNNFNGTQNNPIYQTFLIGIKNYRFDVADGLYEITLHFAEPFDEGKRKNPAMQTGADKDGKRIFNVYSNDSKIIGDLDLAGQYGAFRAVPVKFSVRASNSKGITIRFESVKGEAIMNGIQIRKK